MTVGYLFKKYMPFDESRKNELLILLSGSAFLSSLVADANIGASWLFFLDISVNYDLNKVLTTNHLIACIIASFSWFSIATDGRNFDLVRLMIWWFVWLILWAAFIIIYLCIAIPASCIECFFRLEHQSLTEPVGDFLEFFRYDVIGTVNSTFGNNKSFVPRFILLISGIFLEDFGQAFFTFYLENKINSNSEGLFKTKSGLVNVVLALYDIGHKIAEIYDLYGNEMIPTGVTFVTHTFRGHKDPVLSLASAGRNKFVSASKDKTAKLWDVSLGKVIRTFRGHSGGISSVGVLPDSRVITASIDGTAKIFEMSTGQCIKTLDLPDKVACLNVSPDGLHFLTASKEGIQAWETTAPYKIIGQYPIGTRSVSFLDNDRFASASVQDNFIHVWNLRKDAEPTYTTVESHSDSVTCVTSLAPKIFLSSSRDKSVKMWDATNGQHLRSFYHKSVVQGVKKVNDKMFVSLSRRKANLWQADVGVCLYEFDSHYGYVRDAIFLPERESIATASDDDTVKLWCIGKYLHDDYVPPIDTHQSIEVVETQEKDIDSVIKSIETEAHEETASGTWSFANLFYGPQKKADQVETNVEKVVDVEKGTVDTEQQVVADREQSPSGEKSTEKRDSSVQTSYPDEEFSLTKYLDEHEQEQEQEKKSVNEDIEKGVEGETENDVIQDLIENVEEGDADGSEGIFVSDEVEEKTLNTLDADIGGGPIGQIITPQALPSGAVSVLTDHHFGDNEYAPARRSKTELKSSMRKSSKKWGQKKT